jgi:hypothetical protein
MSANHGDFVELRGIRGRFRGRSEGVDYFVERKEATIDVGEKSRGVDWGAPRGTFERAGATSIVGPLSSNHSLLYLALDQPHVSVELPALSTSLLDLLSGSFRQRDTLPGQLPELLYH